MGKEWQFRRLRRLSKQPLPGSTVCYAKKYLSDYPDHGVAWLLLGIALVELGRYEEAQQAISKAIRMCPRDKRQIPLAHMGHLFKAAGDYDRAAAWFRRAILADPVDAKYHIYLGGTLAEQGRLRQAEKVHRKGIECSDGPIEEAHFNLGLILRSLERFEEAADCFREAIRRDPRYREAKTALRDVEQCIRLTELVRSAGGQRDSHLLKQ